MAAQHNFLLYLFHCIFILLVYSSSISTQQQQFNIPPSPLPTGFPPNGPPGIGPPQHGNGPPPQQFIAANIGATIANAAVNSLDPCRYFENVTDVQQLNQHEYVAFEQCLYYFLANRAQHQAAGVFGAIHPIATLPPAYKTSGGRGGNTPKEIKVHIGQITLQHFQLNEFLKDLRIVGYMELEWEDERLSWDQNQFKVDTLKIHGPTHIWMPLLSSQSYETSLRNDDAMEVRSLETTSKGNVSAVVSFSLKTFCDDTDFRHFPDDVYKCCYVLEPHFNQELIEFSVDGLPVFTDPKYFRDYGWAMSGTIPSVNPDPSVVSQLNFCINLQRSSSAVKVELWLPTWACAIVFLFSPLIGTVRSQLYVKLFLLFLQLLTLQLFSNRIAPHLGSAAATPVVVALHELAIVLNVCSIVFSVVILMFTRVKRTLPPWGWLSRVSQMINKFVLVSSTPLVDSHNSNYITSYDPYADAVQLEKGTGVGGANGLSTIDSSSTSHKANGGSELGRASGFQAEWNAAFLAVHALGVTLLSLVFILGYLLIR